MARNVADKLSTALGQQIVVDNRGGAGGTSAPASSPRPRPTATPFASYTARWRSAAMNANAGYDPHKDFTPIGMIGAAPMCS